MNGRNENNLPPKLQKRIDADLETLRQLIPNARLVYNGSRADPFRVQVSINIDTGAGIIRHVRQPIRIDPYRYSNAATEEELEQIADDLRAEAANVNGLIEYNRKGARQIEQEHP